MLWFEPERVFRGSAWHKEHPQWLLGPMGDNLLFNLGKPQACEFLVGFISQRIKEYGLGCYRQDFNIDPLPFWRAADAPDRQGITEIRYIEGLYAFWDGLLENNPGLIIDNCASGGRRLDLETLGRATPFWRTDGPRDPIAHQCHSYGLFSWIPLSATSQDRALDTYEFRSSMSSSLCLNWWVSGDAPAQRIGADFPFDWARSILEQYLGFRDLFYGDYYPLTGYSQAPDQWMAYQFDKGNRGMLVVLRRPSSPYESARFGLKGLDAEASYKVRDLDTGAERRLTGAELSQTGLEVRVNERPGSALVVYEK
jgi:alpha-galactosidase